MTLIIKLIEGNWFRKSISAEKYTECINLPHIKEHIKIYSRSDGDLIEVLKRPIVVGRKKEPSHLVSDEDDVSGVHAKIEHHFENWVISDLGSKNGTFIKRGDNVIPVTSGETSIQKEDIVRFGETAKIKIV